VSGAANSSDCVFCDALKNSNSADSLILFRGIHNFVILNRYPYNNGHTMIAPYLHASNPVDVNAEIVEEMMRLCQRALHALREVYKADGFNIGMNIGKPAGAGIDEHYHLHVVPRWNGDTNFMTALADTRVIPEEFAATIAKLRPFFEE